MPGPAIDTKLARLAVGAICSYCRRALKEPHRRALLSATRDHVVPKCRGGKRWVIACQLCNRIKGDITPAAWSVFTAAFPGWWRTFRTNHELRLAMKVLIAPRVAL